MAFFYFCETLVSFQTADAFVDYVRKEDGNLYMRFLNLVLLVLSKARVVALFNKFFPGSSFSKKVKLLQLRGFGIEKLNILPYDYYKKMIIPELIEPVIGEMKRLSLQDYDIYLVSAGYSIYLKYFAEDYHIEHLISTEIAFNPYSNKCLGTISGSDCIHLEKVNRLKSYLISQNINYRESISYSDSISDLPLLLMTGNGVVVSKGNSQPWRQKYKLTEIIWHKT
jgi:HAD superfamily phosphoserine phosphatase-like hydrolase